MTEAQQWELRWLEAERKYAAMQLRYAKLVVEVTDREMELFRERVASSQPGQPAPAPPPPEVSG